MFTLLSFSCSRVLFKAGRFNESKFRSNATPPANVIWVHAYARSGSSSVLSMISLNSTTPGGQNNKVSNNVIIFYLHMPKYLVYQITALKVEVTNKICGNHNNVQFVNVL